VEELSGGVKLVELVRRIIGKQTKQGHQKAPAQGKMFHNLEDINQALKELEAHNRGARFTVEATGTLKTCYLL
jgi:hypothetical protein